MTRPFFLSNSQAEQVHQATLEVLEQTGIFLDNEEAETLLLTAGARKKGDRVTIPKEVVEKALSEIKHSTTIYDRNGEPALKLENGSNYFGPGSDALYQRDINTGKIRESRLEDVTYNVKLADALGFDFIMSMALPRRLKKEILYPAIFAEMAKNTTRPIVTTCVTLEDIKHIHQIAQIITNENGSSRPFYIAYLEPLSPLRFDKVGIDKLLYCSENEIPFIFGAGANSGVLAPVTPEGGVVQGGAESLAGLVIAFLKNPQAKFIYGSNTSSADMRTGFVCYGAGEWFRTVAMYADMGKYYDLPSWGTAGCTDAMEIDGQAAWEAYRGIMMAVQSRSSLVHDMGYMCFGELYDPLMLVLVIEMLKEAKHLLKPAELTEEALSVKVIHEVATTSSFFLSHPDTAKNHKKRIWNSKLINRSKIGQDYKQQTNRLKNRVREIVSGHNVEPLDLSKDKKITQYLESISSF
ncbi:MAG: hypothetical protein HN580_09785 [Deltaproteobacteria bacterium]|nr:hypothetical protein [Deltaproteobacteria bacterium]MBT4639633.1 hypothetical protein [Deltaproteobacteria bacterium]MBT7151502.1 hypothetical protein [Deltaproteobacteria bacterium]MBT7889301.1 hypothetical protein [Deltaproteobacteria bacterium]